MYTRDDLRQAESKTPAERAAVVLEYSKEHNLMDYQFSVDSIYVCQSQGQKNPKTPVTDHPVCPELRFGTVLDQIEKEYPGESICVFNFGNYLKGGGEFGEGLIHTDEEKLCECSNLYRILHSKEVQSGFYDLNAKAVPLKPYGPRILYVPEVVFYGKNRDLRADVLTCSISGMEELGQYIKNADTVVRTTIMHRFNTSLNLAYRQGARTIIMGCFGSETNGNDPWYSYNILKRCVEQNFRYCFRKIIVTASDRRYFLISSGEKKAESKKEAKTKAEEAL